MGFITRAVGNALTEAGLTVWDLGTAASQVLVGTYAVRVLDIFLADRTQETLAPVLTQAVVHGGAAITGFSVPDATGGSLDCHVPPMPAASWLRASIARDLGSAFIGPGLGAGDGLFRDIPDGNATYAVATELARIGGCGLAILAARNALRDPTPSQHTLTALLLGTSVLLYSTEPWLAALDRSWSTRPVDCHGVRTRRWAATRDRITAWPPMEQQHEDVHLSSTGPLNHDTRMPTREWQTLTSALIPLARFWAHAETALPANTQDPGAELRDAGLARTGWFTYAADLGYATVPVWSSVVGYAQEHVVRSATAGLPADSALVWRLWPKAVFTLLGIMDAGHAMTTTARRYRMGATPVELGLRAVQITAKLAQAKLVSSWASIAVAVGSPAYTDALYLLRPGYAGNTHDSAYGVDTDVLWPLLAALTMVDAMAGGTANRMALRP